MGRQVVDVAKRADVLGAPDRALGMWEAGWESAELLGPGPRSLQLAPLGHKGVKFWSFSPKFPWRKDSIWTWPCC